MLKAMKIDDWDVITLYKAQLTSMIQLIYRDEVGLSAQAALVHARDRVAGLREIKLTWYDAPT